MHIDDLEVLNYIQGMLGKGNIYISQERGTVLYSVVTQSKLRLLIAIFAKYNLNSTKHLNFWIFTQALTQYTHDSSSQARLKLKPVLDNIINYMNSKRINFDLYPYAPNFNISANWLLGFVEGEGYFYFSSNKLFLSIT